MRRLLFASVVGLASGLLVQIGAARAEPATVARTVPKLLVQASLLSNYEIAAGELALGRAEDPRLRHFAAQMVAAHRHMAAQIGHLAFIYGVALPASATSANQRSSLSSLAAAPAGPAFDQAYVLAEVRSHVDAINLFSTYSIEGRAPAAVDFAVHSLSTDHAHYTKAERLWESMGAVATVALRR